MLKVFNPISVTLFSVSLFAAFIIPTRDNDPANSPHPNAPGHVSSSVRINKFYTEAEAELIYQAADLENSGLSMQAFKYAYFGYVELLNKKKIVNSNYLSICDFSQSSGQKRLYIIDIEKNELVTHTYVAHGRNSGIEYAKNFSNTPRSNQSSLGFYITGETYIGGHGFSLRLNGIEGGINDKALARRIVLHGSAYVGEKYMQYRKLMGRSFGCPAVPKEESRDIINTIKNGSCLFIYHPSKKYLDRSKILNV